MPVLDNLLVSLGFKVNTDPLKHVNEALEGVNHKLEILAGIELARGLAELVEHFSHFGDDLEMAAYQAGITAEQFQKLVYAGSQFNVGQEQIQAALAKMSRLLDGARQGSKKAIEVFEKLGISQEQLAGFQNAEDAFYAVQDALAAIPDSIRRVAATQQIFGRGATALTKFAASGSKTTKALGAEAVKMGAIVSNEGIAGLAEFEDRMQAFSLTVRAFFGNMAAALAPAFKELVMGLQEIIGANSKLASQNLDVWSERIAFALGFATEMFRLITIKIHDFIESHPKLIALVGKTAASLISMSVAGGVLNLALRPLRLTISVISASLALLGAKTTLIIGGIFALILGIKALWDMAHGKDFKDTALATSLNWLTGYAQDAMGAYKEMRGEVEKPIGAIAPPVFRPVTAAQWAGLTGTAGDMNLSTGADFLKQMATVGSAANGRLGAALPGGQASLLEGPPAPSPVSIKVDAPLTVNMNGPADLKAVEALIKKHATSIADETYARTQRETAPAAMR